MLGTVLSGRYELIKELYEHPLFTAFLAKDRQTGKDICIRILKPVYAAESNYKQKLYQIFKKTRVRHPHLEYTYELVESDQYTFLVSDYIPGYLLYDQIHKLAPFSPVFAISIALSICKGLKALHDKGEIHGDLSPLNIKVDSEGDAVLMLPGLWSSYSASPKVGMAILPHLAPYLAPEVHSESMPSASSDIYAVGILLYELLTGRQPYTGSTIDALALKHSTAPIPSVRMHHPVVPVGLDEIIQKCLKKTPATRYLNIKLLIHDLQMLQEVLRFGKIRNDLPPKKNVQEIQKDFMKVPKNMPKKEERFNTTSVAPKMSALRPESRSNQVQKKSSSSGVNERMPRLFVILAYLGLTSILMMLGSWVYFNISKPKLIKVPNLVGLKVSEATQTLKAAQLGMNIQKRETTDQYPEGVIIDVHPSVGQEVRENSFVFTTVSLGSRFIEVPDLRGRTVDESKALLRTLSLDLEEPYQKVKAENVEIGRIVGHIPESGKKIERFSKIKVQVSGHVQDGTPSYGASLERHYYKIKIRLPGEASRVLVRVDMTDEQKTKTVYEKLHHAKDSFEIETLGYGKEVLFRIFFDGDLVKQIQKKAEKKAENNSEEATEQNKMPMSAQEVELE